MKEIRKERKYRENSEINKERKKGKKQIAE